MATISKHGKSWQAKIRKKGFPSQCKTFPKKSEAERWARAIESEMDRGIFVSAYEAENTLLKELFERYLKEVVPNLKSWHSVTHNLNRLSKHLGHLTAASLTPRDVKDYREFRLETVKDETARKELLLLGRVIKVAQKEWEIVLPRGNPVDSITLPKKGKARERRLKPGELEVILEGAKTYGSNMDSIVIIAIETAARRGEIANLLWKDINLIKRTALLRDTKNGEDRCIPLSSKVVEVLNNLPDQTSERVFPVRSDSIGQAFRRITDRANIEGLRFHDLRHEATSRFFELGLGIMEVSSITGHKDLAMLKRYTHLKAEDLALKLA